MRRHSRRDSPAEYTNRHVFTIPWRVAEDPFSPRAAQRPPRPPLQRHLSTLDPFEVHVAGARFWSLPTTPGGLAASRTLSATHSLLAVLRARRSAQLMEIHPRNLISAQGLRTPAFDEPDPAAGSSGACDAPGPPVPRVRPLASPDGGP